jgi:dTDP-4-dehydrorhamnose 3,5-epimerase
MDVEPLSLPGVLLVTPRVYQDQRGFFQESWNHKRWQQILQEHGQPVDPFVQDNHSRSSHAVLRGLHYQLPPEPQAKLVRCINGAIFDVAVDVRRSSPTFGSYVGVELTSENHRQLWIPAGFAHGFLTLSRTADVLYKTTHFWSASCERSILWNDPSLAIPWPLDQLTTAPTLSPKDAEAPLWPARDDSSWYS